MYSRARRKIHSWIIIYMASIVLIRNSLGAPSSNETTKDHLSIEDNFENNIIDSDAEYEVEYNKKYGINPSWQIGEVFNKNTHKYTMINEAKKSPSDRTGSVVEIIGESVKNVTKISEEKNDRDVNESKEISKEIKEGYYDVKESTRTISTITEQDSRKDVTTNEEQGSKDEFIDEFDSAGSVLVVPILKIIYKSDENKTEAPVLLQNTSQSEFVEEINETTQNPMFSLLPNDDKESVSTEVIHITDTTKNPYITEPSTKIIDTTLKTLNISLEASTDAPLESHNQTERRSGSDVHTTTEVIEINDPTVRVDKNTDIDETAVPIYTELDYETDVQVPEDYYDGKDLMTTAAPNKDALSLIVGLAGSVAESVAERILPKTIFDLYKRMQKQNEAIEAERLRSREENGGLGQFGRGILKSISTGITRPFNQLMAGARDIGSLDSDRGFINGLASGVAGVADGVANVANSVSDAFKDRVQAIFPGTLWCGDGHSATARSHELGLFFLTDTCCRQHDACKLFIRSGHTKHGLTNTGLFTRSHCSCDANFRSCLKKTNSLVSSQIGLTYFNVLGPQCFRKSHPIVRCVRRTRLTGLKCEEYELDHGKPKMWQWFDNETF